MERWQPRLSDSGYRTIEALLDAGPGGLSNPQLRNICGDAIGILRRLRDAHPDWKAVIHFPGDDGLPNYRIGPARSDPSPGEGGVHRRRIGRPRRRSTY